MKVLLVIILCFLCIQWADGQWYNRSCGVVDINNMTAEDFDCLWKKSTTIAKVGGITSIVGTTILVTGAITMIAADPCCSSGMFLIGYFTALTGAAVDVIGVPIWRTGAHRKSILRNNPHYSEQASGTMTISPLFLINYPNQSYSLGFTVSLCF